MQWISLALVVVLGGATLLTQSARFMMIKPTIVHIAVAAVMFGRICRPVQPIAQMPKEAVLETLDTFMTKIKPDLDELFEAAVQHATA